MDYSFSRPIALLPMLLLLLAGGSTAAGEEHVHITESNGYRYIVSDGLPNHETGPFPNRNNPNRIQLQYHRFRVPLAPKAEQESAPFFLMPFGVALNGIPFDPGAAEFWNGDRNWQYEALEGVVNLGLDANNAHVQPTGAYHYHGRPTGLIDRMEARENMLLLGYAADGFPIYANRGYQDAADPSSGLRTLRSSYRLKDGRRVGGPGGAYDGAFVQDYRYEPGSGDLDECNGRTGPTPEYPEGTYYYVITENFPFIPRRFRGTPDESFMRRGPGGGGHPGAGPPPQGSPPPGRRSNPPGPSGQRPPPRGHAEWAIPPVGVAQTRGDERR